MQLMSSVFSIARKKWGWIRASPIVDVRKPPQSPRRNRLVTDDELAALAISAGSDPANATARAFMAFRFFIETGMCAGEVIGLESSWVDLVRRVAHLPKTKNGESRDMPLSSVAVSILEKLKGDPVFGLR
ncbi:tyrosine-type recombinase/integrase [Octadecabacter antarcticus]|nr:tyrosine-type recombinase/integrase [Octadecabacter antarcticus]